MHAIIPVSIGELKKLTIDRRQLLAFFLFLVPVVIAATLAGRKLNELKKPKVHNGAFSDDFSANFDVDRTEYPLLFGSSLIVAGNEVFLKVPGLDPLKIGH